MLPEITVAKKPPMQPRREPREPVKVLLNVQSTDSNI